MKTQLLPPPSRRSATCLSFPELLSAGDLEGATACFARDACLLTQDATAIHTRTGVSIVAVLRADEAFPAPTADFVLEPDDIAVAVGTPAGVKALHQLRRGQ